MELESRRCDLGKDFNDIEGSNAESEFFKASSSSYKDLQTYASRLRCLTSPEKQLEIWGNYDTTKTSNLLTVFDRCNPNDNTGVVCQSDEKIEEWLKGKYFLTIMNNKQFSHENFDNNRVIKTSNTYWVPINPFSRTESVFKITRTEMHLNDK